MVRHLAILYPEGSGLTFSLVSTIKKNKHCTHTLRNQGLLSIKKSAMTVNRTRKINGIFKGMVCAFSGRIWNTCCVRRSAVGDELDCGWTWCVDRPNMLTRTMWCLSSPSAPVLSRISHLVTPRKCPFSADLYQKKKTHHTRKRPLPHTYPSFRSWTSPERHSVDALWV